MTAFHLPIHIHDHAWSAVSTLGAVEAGYPVLNGVVAIFPGANSLHSRHLPPIHTVQGTQALGVKT